MTGSVLRTTSVLRITVAGQRLELVSSAVEGAVAGLEPEPLREHYAVIGGRRYPPKQVLAVVTGLDRADFTTHQARSVLQRLGFGVYRRTRHPGIGDVAPVDDRDPISQQGAEAAALAPYRGRWVAQDSLEILFDAESPEAVLSWLRRHGLRARVWRVPASQADTGSALSADSNLRVPASW